MDTKITAQYVCMTHGY